MLKGVRGRRYRSKCEPEEFPAEDIMRYPSVFMKPGLMKTGLMQLSFKPSVAAVLTIAAPHILLSVAVFALLIALGIYFGFTWTRDLDTNAGPHDSRNVFIFYVFGLAVCIGVYMISSVIQDDEEETEYNIVEQYCDEWLDAHEDVVRSWNLQAVTVNRRGRDRVELRPLDSPNWNAVAADPVNSNIGVPATVGSGNG
jgi:hypothetical protein